MADENEERPADRQEINRRLRKVEGQIRGLQRMVDEERDCEAIIIQLMAARAALNRIGVYIINEYVEKCLRETNRETATNRIKRTLDIITKLSP